jgi:hypothetical protein
MKSFGWFTILLLVAGVTWAEQVPQVILASSSDTPQFIVHGPSNTDSALVARLIKEAKDAVSPELINAIEEAGRSQEAWDQAIRDPEGYLADRGVPLNGAAVRLFQRPFTAFDSSTCPDGLVPVRVEHWVETCVRQMELVWCTQLPDGWICVSIWVCVGPKWEIQVTTECALPVKVYP